jgi:hypothetical protein
MKRKISVISNTGLTFIEMLLATVMVAVISVALYGMLSSGITVWSELNNETSQIDISLFFERLEIELKNCIYFKDMEFVGGKEGFSFPAVVTIINRDNGLQRGLGKIEYSYSPGEGVLMRNGIEFQQAGSMQKRPARILMSNIMGMDFSYYFFSNEKKQFFFSDIWPPETSEKVGKYPQALRLTLAVDMGKKIQKFTKTINIPVAGKK